MLRAVLLGAALAALPVTAAQAQTTKPAAAKPAVKIEDKYATSDDGTKIHYLASGQGPLVLAIHGFPDYSGSWNKLAPKLNDKYRFVAIDTRGYNLSGQPEGVANYAMPKLVQDVQAVIKAEGAVSTNWKSPEATSALTLYCSSIHMRSIWKPAEPSDGTPIFLPFRSGTDLYGESART